MPQVLMSPLSAHFDRQDAALLLEHTEELTRLGYELEDFGHWSLILENVFYSSLAAVSRAVFDGTFRAAKRPRIPFRI